MKTSWGSRIASTFALAPLLGACGAPPPPEPPPPPPPPSATAPVASAPVAPPPPPAPAPKVGAFIAMGDGTGPSHPIHADRHFARASTFMLVAADLTPEYGNPACPISAPSCTVMAIAKFGAPLSVTDRLGGVEPATAPAFGKIVPSDVNVFDLSGGQDVVYAASLKEGKLAIFKVGEDMKATLFAEDTHELNWQQAEVIETADGHVVIGVVRNEGPDQLVVAHIEERGGKKMLGPLLRLPYGMVPKYRQSAQGARYPESEGMQPVWDFHATPLLDASGKVDKSWALAIMQVNPPPFSWKAGKPYKKPAEKGSKHGCGGPGSRSLSDKSVEKIVKVLRFDGAKLVSEHSVDRPQTRDLLSEPFDAHPALDGGVEVDGTVWGKEGKQSGAKGKVKKTPLPTILETVEMVNPGWHRTATFDPETNEGLMAWTGEGGFVRRFDADGKPKGPVEPVKNFGQGTLYKVKGEWLNLDSHQATWLTGPHKDSAGTWNYQVGTGRDVKLTGDKLSVFVWTNRSCGMVPLDLDSLASGRLEPFTACDGNYYVSTPVKLPSGKMGIVRTTNRGATVDVATLDGDATPLADDTTPPGKHVSSTMHKVWNDVVIVRRGTEGMTATWVSAGKTITGIPLPPKPDAKRGSERINGGPVIDGDLLLPDEPGMPIVVPAFAEAAKKGCTGYTVAGRHKAVISCLEASDPVKPGLVPGLRWFSY